MHDSIAKNNYIYDASSGIIVSESPNNQIYSNTIEGATRAGILLFNPPEPDDGFTEDNHVYNNTISNSEDGIREIRSDGNILEDNKFFNIESDD
jgi:parallel beta-helix repeat protein